MMICGNKWCIKQEISMTESAEMRRGGGKGSITPCPGQ
jgi:hypothetical protein